MGWGFKVRAVLATAVVVFIPAASLDAIASANSPVTWLIRFHPAAAVVALALTLGMSAKLADWLLDTEWITMRTASMLSMLAMAAQLAAFVIILNALQH